MQEGVIHSGSNTNTSSNSDSAQLIKTLNNAISMSGAAFSGNVADASAKIGAVTIDSTIKVAEIDDQTAIDRTFSEAKYAKGIGLVYRSFLYWNKGNVNGTFSDASYGVVMKMIDHN